MTYIDVIHQNIERLMLEKYYAEAADLLNNLKSADMETIEFQILDIEIQGQREEKEGLNTWLLENLDMWCLRSKAFSSVLHFAKENGYDELFLKAYCFSYILNRSKSLAAYDDYIAEKWIYTKACELQVFQGTMNIANQMTILTESVRAKGVHISSYSLEPKNYLGYSVDYHYDFTSCADDEECIKEIIKMVSEVIYKYNVFHFHFGISMLQNHVDLYLIKKFNKKIIMQHWGSDVRRIELAQEVTPFAVAKASSSEILASLDKLKDYVDLCIVADMELFNYVKSTYSNIKVIPIAINLKTVTCKSPKAKMQSNEFVIVHAPTSQEFKGTEYVNRAVKNLIRKGYNINYKLVEGVSNERALEIYCTADLVVDQLRAGQFGFLAIENMVLENPVIAYISDYMKPYQAAELPIISADPNSIESCLEYWINHREELRAIGVNGKKYVEKYHDIDVISQAYIEVYKNIFEG